MFVPAKDKTSVFFVIKEDHNNPIPSELSGIYTNHRQVQMAIQTYEAARLKSIHKKVKAQKDSKRRKHTYNDPDDAPKVTVEDGKD